MVVVNRVGMVRKNENLVVVLCDRLNIMLLMMVVFEWLVLGISVKVWVMLILRVFSGVMLFIVLICVEVMFMWFLLWCFIYRMMRLLMMKVMVIEIGLNSIFLIWWLNRKLRMVVGRKVMIRLIIRCWVLWLVNMLVSMVVMWI